MQHARDDRSSPYPLGVHPRDGGVDVAVLAPHARRVHLCLIDHEASGGWTERRVDLPHRTHGVWHGFVPDVPVGQRYGLRVDGPWDPVRGHRHNPAKLLLDPYARAVAPPARLAPDVFAHIVGADLTGDHAVRDDRDSLAHAAHALVVPSSDDRRAGRAPRPEIPWSRTVIYETHVRGFTRLLPRLPDRLRGTYAGLGHPATIEHLLSLGVTTLELLPVHTIVSESHLERRGLTNHWGYNTLGFFAPHPGYAVGHDPIGAVEEFRAMTSALHEAGLEVLLDVVYNHTCEGDVRGPCLSFRGLDAAGYYRLDEYGRDIDVTGCGNSLDARNPWVVRLILDSLRYWVEEMGVDGFRFDLAPTLARGQHGFDPDHATLVAMRADPVLSRAKLIVEPWDVGPDGWRTGQFPPPFGEWNDRFRDGVREFWLPGAARARAGEPPGGLRDLGTRLAGSADTFPALRGPLASVNFVTAHDGFTLADCTSYNGKHNLGNGEGNRDGTDHNRSWNHGVEGATDDAEVLAARRRSMRNLLGTLLLSAGVPMLLAGDEFGRTQHGNNNAYCQDNAVSWVDWRLRPWQHDLLTTTRFLVGLRAAFPALHRTTFYEGRPVAPGAPRDLSWFAPEGVEMDHERWQDWYLRCLQVLVWGGDEGSLLLVVQGAPSAAAVTLPRAPRVHGFLPVWNSAMERPPAGIPALTGPDGGPADAVLPAGARVSLGPLSLHVFRAAVH